MRRARRMRPALASREPGIGRRRNLRDKRLLADPDRRARRTPTLRATVLPVVWFLSDPGAHHLLIAQAQTRSVATLPWLTTS